MSLVVRFTGGYSDSIPPGSDAASFSGAEDLDFGVRHGWKRSRTIQPFVGGGLAVLCGSSTLQFDAPWWYGGHGYVQVWSSTAAGPFVDAGFYHPFREKWTVGVLFTYNQGHGSLNGKDIEIGGFQVHFLIGRSFERKS